LHSRLYNLEGPFITFRKPSLENNTTKKQGQYGQFKSWGATRKYGHEDATLIFWISGYVAQSEANLWFQQ